MNIFIIFFFIINSFSCLVAHEQNTWAYKTLEKMTLDEKIGQLFMVAGYVDPEFASKEIGNPQIIQEIDHYIDKYHIGGIAYAGPSESCKQVLLTNHYQTISKYPLLIAQDLEWGLAMRLSDGMQFPKNITLGAINNDTLIYEMGKEIGKQAKLIGVHMNLSPVLDVNIEPENLVINVRSFGSSPQLVAKKGVAMIQGLQDAGIIASAKHFPGLGDVSMDPHIALPCSKQGKKRLHDVELYPFSQAIKAGLLSIQTDHLLIPSIEPDPHVPSSLSSNVVSKLLKNELSFKGLVLSGALRMKALTSHFTDEEIVLKAFLAGSDMLLMPQDLPKAHRVLKNALANGEITQRDVNEKVLKILGLKEKVKLHQQRVIDVPSSQQLNSFGAQELKKNLFQSAVSFVRNNHQIERGPIAYVQLGESSSDECLNILGESLKFDTYFFPSCIEEKRELIKKLENYSLIILAVYPLDPRRIGEIRLLNSKQQQKELDNFRVHGLTEPMVELSKSLQLYQNKTIVTFFGNPFGVSFFDEYSTFLMAYEDIAETQQIVADLLLTELKLFDVGS